MIRQRRESDPQSHEVYFNGQFVEGALDRKEAKRKKRMLARREAKRRHEFK